MYKKIPKDSKPYNEFVINRFVLAHQNVFSSWTEKKSKRRREKRKLGRISAVLIASQEKYYRHCTHDKI
jgi:hypothetical protein